MLCGTSQHKEFGQAEGTQILQTRYSQLFASTMYATYFGKLLSDECVILFQMFVHTSMDTLYAHVSKDDLPSDYGGNLDSMETYHSEFSTLSAQN
jgi:hypothetical protein